MELGLIALAFTLTLLVLRVHIGVTMLMGGALCYLAVNGGDWRGLLFTLNNLAYSRLSNYDLAVVPLFVLMGQFATHGGLSRLIFHCAAAWGCRRLVPAPGLARSAVHRWPPPRP